MSTAPDHYKVLGVTRDASAEDIERARKALARHWHPDRNTSEDAAQHFDEVQKAAEILRNPVLRAAYDRESAAAAAIGTLRGPGAAGRPHDPGGLYVPGGYYDHHGLYDPDQDDIDERPDTEQAGTAAARVRTWARSPKIRLGAAIVAAAAVAGLIAVAASGHPARSPVDATAGRGPASGAPAPRSTTGNGTGTKGMFMLPPYAATQAVFPVRDGEVLSVGSAVTLLAASGQVIWHEKASVSALNAGTAGTGGPQASGACAVAGDVQGQHYEFISLTSGAQAVITEGPSAAGDSFALAGRSVALPDGTIRDACTGAVTARAAPAGTFSTADCLIGSTVVGAGRLGLMAWQNGHELWRLRAGGQFACDPDGSAVMLSGRAGQISFVNPLTGRSRWTVHDPACPADCLGGPASPVRLLGAGSAVILAGPDQTLALARKDGKLLWRTPGACALARRSAPDAEVLLASCAGGTDTVTVVSPVSGATITTYKPGGSGCAQGGEWRASSRQLLVVCPDPAAPGQADEASLINW